MMLFYIQRRMYAGVVILLVLPLSYGKIVQGNCSLYTYPHPNHSNSCLFCRICPESIFSDKNKFGLHREPLCGNATLPDGRKVQCTSTDFEPPSCREWKPTVGHLNCTNNNVIYSMCRLTCPTGYEPTDEVRVTCLVTPHIHWSHQLPVCQDIDECHRQNLTCSHKCENTMGSAHCSCPQGFTLHSDGKQCVDINECVNNSHGCSWRCVNTNGSAYCICEVGFSLSQDGKTCLDKKNSRIEVNTKHAHRVLSGFAVFFLCVVFLPGPCLILNCLIQWKKKQTVNQREANQEFENQAKQVKIKLINAKQSQRCYVLRHKWIAKKGSNVTVSAYTDTYSITNLVVIKKESNRSTLETYSSSPSAPNEIVLHNISAHHKGQYDWITHLSNNKTECGSFHLDVKQLTVTELAVRYTRQCSGDQPYEEMDQQEDYDRYFGFDHLLKNMRDVKRLCVLFDQDERPDTVSWHVIAMSHLINYDRQAVNHDEYHLKSKSGCQGPTYKMLMLMNQNGKSVTDFVDFLKTKLGPSCEPIQILNKYI